MALELESKMYMYMLPLQNKYVIVVQIGKGLKRILCLNNVHICTHIIKMLLKQNAVKKAPKN